MDTDKMHQRGEELMEKCGDTLKIALRDTAFELGFNGEKYELTLSPEGLRSRLFPLVYFQRQASESVLEHWNIWVGRQPCAAGVYASGVVVEPSFCEAYAEMMREDMLPIFNWG